MVIIISRIKVTTTIIGIKIIVRGSKLDFLDSLSSHGYLLLSQ